jgi:hypothetical protein
VLGVVEEVQMFGVLVKLQFVVKTERAAVEICIFDSCFALFNFLEMTGLNGKHFD